TGRMDGIFPALTSPRPPHRGPRRRGRRSGGGPRLGFEAIWPSVPLVVEARHWQRGRNRGFLRKATGPLLSWKVRGRLSRGPPLYPCAVQSPVIEGHSLERCTS